MMLSPVTSFKYSTLSFGKNPQKPKGDGDNKPKSSQNNSPEVYISPETYAALMGMGIVDKMEESGMFDPDSDFNKKINETMAPVIGIEDDYDFDFEEEDFQDNIVDAAADSTIFSIKTSAELLGEIPEELKGKVPVFVDFSANDFIKSLEKSLEEQENFDYSAIQPDYDAIEEELSKLSDEERANTEEMLESTYEFLTDEEQMQQMFDTQRKMIELYKGDKKPKLQDALHSLSNCTNYMLFKAINAGFEGDARAVISALSSDMISHTRPKTEDMGDGTTLTTYNELTSEVQVLRDKETGDYISASMKKNGQEVCSVDFKKDGSIKSLVYKNVLDNSAIRMTTSDMHKRILVEQTGPSGVCQRIFDKKPNGDLEQTACQIRMFF